VSAQHLGAFVLGTAMAVYGASGSCQKPNPAPAGLGGGLPADTCAAAVLDPCGLAGERLCQLECRSSSGVPLWRTPDGGSFAAACRAALEDGRNWRPDCLARISDCSQVEAAYRAIGGASCPQ
jgi:hypothetical protein